MVLQKDKFAAANLPDTFLGHIKPSPCVLIAQGLQVFAAKKENIPHHTVWCHSLAGDKVHSMMICELMLRSSWTRKFQVPDQKVQLELPPKSKFQLTNSEEWAQPELSETGCDERRLLWYWQIGSHSTWPQWPYKLPRTSTAETDLCYSGTKFREKPHFNSAAQIQQSKARLAGW